MKLPTEYGKTILPQRHGGTEKRQASAFTHQIVGDDVRSLILLRFLFLRLSMIGINHVVSYICNVKSWPCQFAIRGRRNAFMGLTLCTPSELVGRVVF